MSDITNELIRLGELREKGLITQEEFDAAKAKLLGQSGDAGGQAPEMPPSSAPPQLPPQSRPSALRSPPSDDIPPGIKGWSWGAFLWNWIWAIFNNTWIGLLALIPGVNLVMIFVLGAKGREWAWKNKKWDSVEHFNRVQRKWSLWGIWLVVIGFVLGLLVMVASFLFIGMAGSKAGTDFMEAMPTSEAVDPSAIPEDSASSMTDESATETVAEGAVPAIAEEALPETTQAEPDVVSDATTDDAAAQEAAAEQARQQQAEMARIKAEADAAKAEAAKAKKEALKAEKALAEQRRRQEEERRAAEELAEQEQMECPYSRGQPLTCSSRQNQPAYCDWNFKACGNPRIAKKESKTTCDGKVSWDPDNNQLIVTEGCRAQFVPVQ